MKTPEQIVKCLRCINSLPYNEYECKSWRDCVYDASEPIPEGHPEYAQFAKDDGRLHSIDCELIGLDAAELIEKLIKTPSVSCADSSLGEGAKGKGE